VGVKGSRPDFESLNLDARTWKAPEEKNCNNARFTEKKKTPK